jgi:hypothetical protein
VVASLAPLVNAREEAPESPESPGPGGYPPDAGGEAQEATERQEEERKG